MQQMVKILHICPMVPSFDTQVSLDFFVNCLGFQVTFQEGDYAICSKDSQSVHFLPAGENIGQMEFYLEIEGIDELWESLRHQVSNLKHKAPFDQPYGMREIHMEVPKTNCLLFIGQVQQN